MSRTQRKARRFAGQILLSVLIIAAVFLLFAPDRIDLPLFSFKRILESREEVNKAKCILEFSSGDQNLLIKFVIPCADQRQWDEVTSKMVRVKHECLMALYHPQMAEFIRQRNFEALRKVLVRALNGVVNQPVDTVFFENITNY
jgi:flagellar basal body-associated protein FliL